MEAASTSSTVTNGGGDGGGVVPPPAPMPVANAPPPFLVKTYEMVDDPSTDKIVSWGPSNNTFVVWDSAEFAKDMLPKYFKHNNFSSFVRQLNTYGFRKVDPDRWEFANEGFLRGQKHLLKNISRRKPVHGHPQHHQLQQQQQPNRQNSACVEVGKFGLEEEVEYLKRDKNVLMQELVRLRQQQQTTDGQLQAMVQRLQGMEQRQQQMMSFLAKAVNSPGFLAQFMQQPNNTSQRISEGNKKRRLKQDGIPDDDPVRPSDGQIVKYQPLMNEAAKAMLRQIMKLDPSSPRLENFGNDASSSTTSNVSGLTLQEFAQSSSFMNCSSAAMSEVQSPAEIVTNHQAPVTQHDAIVTELSEMVPESNDAVIGFGEIESSILVDPTSEKDPFEIGGLSPDPNMEWDGNLLDEIPELPGVGDPFWEKFLESPTTVDGAEMADELCEGNETNMQHLAQITKQMGLLSSDVKKL
ncbi:hypothetical protein CASFOL_037016 [Castilleja foliolosa]|uniref:Heat stress transcription factor n=1 Tax=Castilleja foliolosa TaxID=1961234 RepID=A0ABD3BPM2_9LAMI